MPSLRFLTSLAVATILATTVVQAAPVPTGFAAIDISRTPGDGAAALAAAELVCPATDSPDVLKGRNEVAEAAELEFFNVQIEAAADQATKDAIQCQKERNKVLKNHCQKQAAEIENDQEEIDKNTVQIQSNIEDVDRNCPGVNEALFIGGNGRSGTAGGTAAPPPDVQNNEADAPNNEADAPADPPAAANNAAAGAPAGFDDIDISKTPGDGAAALAAAEIVCPATDSPDVLKGKNEIAEAAELEFFNIQIEAAADQATKDAIQCQKERNKVLKNHCQKQAAEIENDQEEIDKNTTQIQSNIEDVDRNCPGVDETLFIGGSGTAGGTAAPPPNNEADAPADPPTEAADPPAASNNGAAAAGPPSGFDAIDISKTPGDGAAALAAAQLICPATDSPDVLKGKNEIAEAAELEFFNIQIEAAADQATKDAIQCQKERNKVLKNHCQKQAAEIENDQEEIDKNTTQIQSNIEDVDRNCPGVDESLFL